MAWKKFSLLGAGSYGTVYLAGRHDYILTGSLVAVKSADLALSSSLRREANLLQELRDCRYVVQGLGADVSLENGRNVYNLVLEYAPGGSLDKMIKDCNGAMAESQIATYTYMLLKGLASIHDKEIVHCDFKPANILVFSLPGSSGISLLKIADFGLSKKVWEGDGDRSPGTPLYASPESVVCGLNEKAGDIWALGCIVVEMITGRPLWSCIRDLRDLLHQIAFGSPKIPENISEDGKDFVKKCLERDHDKRWTAEMLLDHPFIVKNLRSSRFGTHLCSQEVVLPNKPWFCSTDLFSTPLKAQSSDVSRPKQLSTKRYYTNPFDLPWLFSRGLFSTPLKAQSSDVSRPKQLSPKRYYTNPFELPWLFSRGLFSTPLKAQSSDVSRPKQLSRKRYYTNPFDLPCLASGLR